MGEESVDDGELADGAVVGVVLAHEGYVEGCLVHGVFCLVLIWT